MTILTHWIDSPVGTLRLEAGATGLRLVTWEPAPVSGAPAPAGHPGSAVLAQTIDQLDAYFAGRLERFSVPLDPQGTAYRRKVWDAMVAIPFGEMRSYGDLARAVGGSARAVGTACATNPIPILIPCHRVRAANGPGGFSGGHGLATKEALLRLEGAVLPQAAPTRRRAGAAEDQRPLFGPPSAR